jgi:hypothetical protein
MHKPTKSIFFLILCFLTAAGTSAQSGATYSFDNFDAPNGVRIHVETPAPVTRRKGRLKLSSKGVSSKDSSLSRPQTTLYTPSGNTMAVSSSLDGFTTGSAQIDSFIVEAGAKNSVDPVLLYSIMHQESTFKRFAVSPKGARGLMQLMPATAARFGVRNIFDPKQNIDAGARYVRFLLDMFDGDIPLALAGYNAGEGAVLKYGRQVPPYRETREYVRRITNRYSLMRDPGIAHSARRISANELASANSEKTVPLALYERHVSAVRLPDGSLQLLSQ